MATWWRCMECRHLVKGLEKRRPVDVLEHEEITTFDKGSEALPYTRRMVVCDSCLEEAEPTNHRRQHRQV